MSYIFDALQRSGSAPSEFEREPLSAVVDLVRAAEKQSGGPAQPVSTSECRYCKVAGDSEALFCEVCGGFQGSVEAGESEGEDPGQGSPIAPELGASRDPGVSAQKWNQVLLWLVILAGLTLLLVLVRHFLGPTSA